MAKKQLILVVETTAAMGPYFKSILTDYLENIIRNFFNFEVPGQKAQPTSEFALVTFNAHGPYNAFLVQRSGWTRDLDNFFDWLRAIQFTGGGFNDAAVAEGLADALMMVPPPCANQSQQNLDGQRHCILIAASNPYLLPTPVYRPQMPNLEQGENTEVQPLGRLADAEAVAKCFSYCPITLSVISPKQIPKLTAIYNAGKRNPRGTDPPLDNVKSPHHLVLISENFIEARAALSRSGTTNLVSNLNPVKMDISLPPSVSGPPPTSSPPVNASIMNNRQSVAVANISQVTVKAEPTTIGGGPMVSSPFQHMQPVLRPSLQPTPPLQTSSPISVSQEMVSNIENVQDQKPIIAQQRTSGPGAANVSILNNLSQARQVMSSATLTGGTSIGLQSIGGTHMTMLSNMMSSVPAPQPVISSAQSGVTSNGGRGPLTGTAQVAQPNSSNIAMSQPMGASMNQGNLAGPQMVQSGMGMNQNMMGSGLGQGGGTGSMMPTPGMSQSGISQAGMNQPGMSQQGLSQSGMSQPEMSQQVQSGMQSMVVNGNSVANMTLSQQPGGGLQSAQSKYVKVWEGNLSGQRQGQPVFITRLEGYRSSGASETLAANWPPTMQIVRLISQDHMNNKQYVGKADFLVFRAMNQHGFLAQLQEKKLCAVIQLPSQTLLLSVSDKACRLIGMLFPGDMVVFKPQISSQQQQQGIPQIQQGLPQMQQQSIPQMQQQQGMPQMQQHQHQQQVMPQMQQQQPQQHQQHQQALSQMQQQKTLPQMQQQQQQQQQMVGPGMGQGYGSGPTRSQLVSQGQVSSQGPQTMPGGGGFLN